jgi:hypothetical protein
MRNALAIVAMLALSALTVGVGGAVASSTYDRAPLHLNGLNPDRWGTAITSAEANVQQRYAGVSQVYCVGVVMNGHTGDSSWVHGLTRYWDKEGCFGRTYSGSLFGLVYDTKSASAWTIFRLTGASVHDLQNP